MKRRESSGALKSSGLILAALMTLCALLLLPDLYALAGQENSNQQSPRRPKRVTPKGDQAGGRQSGQQGATTGEGQQSNSNTQPPRAYRVEAPRSDVQMEKIMSIGGKELPPDNIEPVGAEITYTTSFSNKGTAPSHNLTIIDPLQDRTDFKLGSVKYDLGTTGLSVTVGYSKDEGEHCDYTPLSGGGGAPEGFDRLVNAVCLSFSGDLGFTPPNNAASFSYVGRRR
ncbi:MAG TPA: hypothetical protein VF544_16150 [Pyrinomonadaceae bacterium]|jgi:uncharacterized repeat protein (TIGR01451 family)